MNRLDEHLPGAPRRRLVLDVRRRLALFGIRPRREQWRTTWEWARNIALSYSKPMWPMCSEIVAQYLALLLADVRQTFGLKLPYRATHPSVPLPDGVRELVAGGKLALPAPSLGDAEVG
jgi:hypothetical protein